VRQRLGGDSVFGFVNVVKDRVNQGEAANQESQRRREKRVPKRKTPLRAYR